jgi:hypothetical protein
MELVGLEDALRPLVREAVEAALSARDRAGLLDARGAAEFLSLSEEAVRTMGKRGKIPSVKLPNAARRYEPEALLAWARGEPSSVARRA